MENQILQATCSRDLKVRVTFLVTLLLARARDTSRIESYNFKLKALYIAIDNTLCCI